MAGNATDWRPGGPATSAAPAGLRYRPITDRDLPLLAEIYASTRREELSRTPWSEQEKERFLTWQFRAQHEHYQKHYQDCEFLIIEAVQADAHTAVGRLYLDRREHEIRVIDIALLPRHRRQGIGTAVLERVLVEAAARCVPVTIHVEHNNPALRWYRRLGFRHVDWNGVYFLMRWSPRQQGQP